MFEFETSLSLPLFKINTLVKYTKVKKPSGISYFLLTLINEGLGNNQKISDLLLEFGVPSDLHSIFAQELKTLIDKDILASRTSYNIDYFSEYTINHFGFTKIGKKVFQDEVLPLGYNEEIKQVVFYNPATKQLEVQISDQIGANNNSFLGDDFFTKLIYPDSDLIKDYYETVKGYSIPIKKEEVILETSIQNVENFQIKYPIKILIDSNGQIKFNFEDSRLTLFFETFFNKKIIEDGFSYKNKFKFDFYVGNSTKLSDESSVDRILFPEEIKKEGSRKSFLDVLSTNQNTTNSKFEFINQDLIDKLDHRVAFIKVYDKNTASMYIPIVLNNDSPIFGDISLNFLIVKKLNNKKIEELVIDLIKQFGKFIEDNNNIYCFENLLAISKFIGRIDVVESKISSWLSDDSESNLVLLERILNKLTNEKVLQSHVKELGIKNLAVYLENSNANNLESKLKLSSWVIKSNGISNVKLLERVLAIKRIGDLNQIELFDLFEKLKFPYEDILVYLNEVVSKLFEKNNSNSKLAAKIKQMIDLLKDLQSITGIDNINKYIIKENIDSNEFISNYKRFKELLEEISFLQKYSGNNLNDIKNYDVLFKEIFDLLSIEKSALSDPKNINEKLIDSKLKNGDIVSAVMYIYSKLTYICKFKFNINGDLATLIDSVSKSKYITKDEEKLLHEFRNYRNFLVHANEKKIDFSVDNIKNVKRIVFRLEGERK